MRSAPNQFNKIIYALIIVGLFGAMFPYTDWLNRVKGEKDLGEATIGQVDTGSFMLKLALLGGARGFAANVLWTRAEELKKAQDWDSLKATVDLITKLQPHFLSVWTYQGWNLAYNVSVEWDAPEDKYHWIKQGIKFLEDGVKKNKKSPDLMWDTAWTYYHKIGFSDESIILRRLFRDDTDDDFKFDPEERLVRNDNFQLGRGWFVQAVKLVDAGEARVAGGSEETIEYVDAPIQRKGRSGDLAFRSMPAHAQTRYAAGLEKASIVGVDATFGEVAKNEWQRALTDWVTFGKFPFPAHNNNKLLIFIDDINNANALAAMSDNARYWTDRWAAQMNYPYWTDRCRAEMTPQGVESRRLFYEGTKAYKAAELPTAVAKFKEGLAGWAKLLEKHPSYSRDDLNKKDTGLIVRRYMRALRQISQPVPEDTPFLDLGKAMANENTPDPFNALEMLPSTGGTLGPAPGQGQGQPQGEVPARP